MKYLSKQKHWILNARLLLYFERGESKDQQTYVWQTIHNDLESELIAEKKNLI